MGGSHSVAASADTASGKQNSPGVEAFKKQAWLEYDHLYAEFEFRCQLAAMIRYYEASKHDKKSYYVECAAEAMGVGSVASLGAGLMKKANVLSSRLGVAGIVGLPLACFLEFMGQGNSKTIPTLYEKAEKHKRAGSGWQRLARLAKSYRILMDDPRYDVNQYAEWYKELVLAREEISNIVNVPLSTYKLFNDPKRVLKPLRKKQMMFQRYMDMEAGKEQVDDNDDEDSGDDEG